MELGRNLSPVHVHIRKTRDNGADYANHLESMQGIHVMFHILVLTVEFEVN